MKILGERVLATEYKEKKEEKTEGGIIIPDVAKKDTGKNVFVVVKVGEDVEHPDIVEGSFVLLGSRTAQGADEVPYQGKNIKIFTENQIIGVERNESEDQEAIGQSEDTTVSN